MAVDLQPPSAAAPADVAEAPASGLPSAATHRTRAHLLLVIAAWQVWMWGTRLVNILGSGEEYSTGFVVVHAVLFTVSFGFAGVLAAVGWRMRREALAAGAGR